MKKQRELDISISCKISDEQQSAKVVWVKMVRTTFYAIVTDLESQKQENVKSANIDPALISGGSL